MILIAFKANKKLGEFYPYWVKKIVVHENIIWYMEKLFGIQKHNIQLEKIMSLGLN